jgi:hypothetical protein
LAAEKQGLEAVYPPPRLCTDNGVMVAWAAVERLRKGATDDPTDMDVRARWPLGTAYPVKWVSPSSSIDSAQRFGTFSFIWAERAL